MILNYYGVNINKYTKQCLKVKNVFEQKYIKKFKEMANKRFIVETGFQHLDSELDQNYFDNEEEKASIARDAFIDYIRTEDYRGLAYRKDSYTSYHMPIIFETKIINREDRNFEEIKEPKQRSAIKPKRRKSRSKSKAKSSGGKINKSSTIGTEFVKK